MNQATKEALVKEAAALADLYNNNQITAPIYYKGLVRLAAEYIACNEVSAAMGVLRLVSENYIKDDLEGQMRGDLDFHTLALALAEMLVDKDVVYTGVQYNFQKPPAEA